MTLKRKTKEKTNNESKRLSVLLKAVGDLLEQSAPDEIEALLNGKLKLQVERSDLKKKRYTKNQFDSKYDSNSCQIAAKLATYNTREDGKEFLKTSLSTKIAMEKFARYLDLPVKPTDTVELLCTKIVESVIGSRLRSEAVQGKKLN